MNSIEGNSLFNFVSSIGWLLDRTGEEEQILSTVWLTGDRQVATCAIPVIPYADNLEALIIRFPCARTIWGVKAAEFHPGCDRWMAKRAFSQSLFYPPANLANQQHNVVMLRLSSAISHMDNASKERLHKQLTKALPQESGFSGRATSVELTSVIQTLVNARRQGTIVICDPRQRPIARIYCENGGISYARYGEKLNEDAIYRLMCSSFKGFFYFQQEKQPEWCDFPPMDKSTAALLLGAYRRLEVRTEGLAPFGDDSAVLFKAKEDPPFDSGPLAQPECKMVWEYLYNGMPISRLIKVCDLDGSQTVTALTELLEAGYITHSPAVPPAPFNLASTALPMDTEAELTEGTEIYAISIDPSSGPYYAPGKILGPRQDGDPWHQIHTIALPEEAIGSPILQGGAVVGLYCGGLVPGKYDKPEFAHGQQLLAAASVSSCGGTGELKPRQSSTSITSTSENLTALVQDPVEIIAVETADNNGAQRVTATVPALAPAQIEAFQSREVQSESGSQSPLSSLLGSLSAVFSRTKKPQTSQPWFEIEVTRTECGSTAWTKATSSTVFRSGDLLRLQIKLLQDAYFYALFQGSNSKSVSLLYPEVLPGSILAKSTVIAIPSRQSDQTLSFKLESGKYSLLGLPILSTARGGTESLLLIASKTPLGPFMDKQTLQPVFTKGTILLNGQKNLDLLEVEEKSLFEGLEVGEVAPNLIALSKLRVSHGS